MKIFIRANFDLRKDNHLWREINFYNEQRENITYKQKIYDYIQTVLEWDLYLQKDIDEFFSLISQAEANPKELYDGGGQQFYLEFHHDEVTFYHNEFDEEDGFPVLSCSLHTFKTAFIAWNAFLQLPKSIHSVVETVIEE